MSSVPLYYDDQYIKTFEARVVKQAIDGDKPYVVLDQTAFYPTGGGQPADYGTINDVKVIDVEKVEGEIRHYIEQELPENKQVFGNIDWKRRFDHMQQHCGQHILSAAFEELFDIETVGFHLGSEIVTIDLNTEMLTDEILEQVEKRANEVIVSNLPIDVKWVTKEELPNYPLRKQPTVTENIRLVIIPDFDYNGCGGTHPRSTAEVGQIKILGMEKNRGNIRLQFACGFRALKEFQQKQHVLNKITAMLRTSELEAPAKLQQILETQLEQGKELEEARETLIAFEAQEIASNQTMIANYKMIAGSFQGRSIKELQSLARKITQTDDESIVIMVTEVEERLQMVFAAGKNVAVKMNELLKTALAIIDGKGGGKPDFAQGGGSALISAEEMVKKVSVILAEQL